MKVSRDQLKELIKECLVEILSEGIGQDRLKESFAKKQGPHLMNRSLDQRVAVKRNDQTSALEKKRINDVIMAESKGDPILASILADTAATTLPTMLMSEGNKHMPVPAGSVESIVATNKPEDLFGNEAASKWATLAFMDSPKKF